MVLGLNVGAVNPPGEADASIKSATLACGRCGRLPGPCRRLQNRGRIGAYASAGLVGRSFARQPHVEADARQSLDGTARIVRLDIDGEVARRAEYDVVRNIRIVAQVESRHQFAITGCTDEEVNMGWPHAMPPLRPDHGAHGAIHRNRISDRLDGPQHIDTIRIRGEDAAIVSRSSIFLNVVEAVGAGLPDRNGRVGERLAIDVAHTAVEYALAPRFTVLAMWLPADSLGDASR